LIPGNSGTSSSLIFDELCFAFPVDLLHATLTFWQKRRYFLSSEANFTNLMAQSANVPVVLLVMFSFTNKNMPNFTSTHG
jgi:hypothetical protein